MDFKYTSRSVADTLELAQNIESEKFPNMVICLRGELGTGKTIFVKGFAKALGIDEEITSPTFTIVKEYEHGELPLYHMDVYRLEDDDRDIGIKDYYKKGGITIIEWADLIEKKLPSERLDITIKIVDENTRNIYITAYGQDYIDICESVL